MLSAIKAKNEEIEILLKEVSSLGDLTEGIPVIMSLVDNAQIRLKKELDSLESKTRRVCRDLGVLNPRDLSLLSPYTQGGAPTHPEAAPTHPEAAPTHPEAASAVPVDTSIVVPPFRWKAEIKRAYESTKTSLENQGYCTGRLIWEQLRREFPHIPFLLVDKRYNNEKNPEGQVRMASSASTIGMSSNSGSTLTEIVDPALCQQVTIPDSKDSLSKVARLLFTDSGAGVLALGLNGVLRLWKWSCNEQNPTGKATSSVTPQHWQPNTGLLMENVLPDNPVASIPCLAISKNDSYVISASGGEVALFNKSNFKRLATFMRPPPASTFLAYDPSDNNIVAIGMDDSSILIYNVRRKEVLRKLEGHQKHITGLAFSTALDTLVSSGADAQLFFWKKTASATDVEANSWKMKRSSAIPLPPGTEATGDTLVEFYEDQVHLLVSHGTLLAIFDASKMECLHKWVPHGLLSSCITYACYTGQQIYASFTDGNIAVFDAKSLTPRIRIDPSAYMPEATPNSALIIPQVIAAHPIEQQVAVGFSDGSIKVMKALDF